MYSTHKQVYFDRYYLKRNEYLSYMSTKSLVTKMHDGQCCQILPLHDIVPAAISHFFILLPQENWGIYSRNEIVITVDHPDTTDVFSNGKLEYPVSLRRASPPPPFGGPPNFIKREKNVARVHAKTPRFSTKRLPGPPPPPFPKSCIRPCPDQYTYNKLALDC